MPFLMNFYKALYNSQQFFKGSSFFARSLQKSPSGGDIFEKERSLYKCIIPSTWFDLYSVNVDKTEIDDLVKQLREETAWFYGKKLAHSIDALLYDFQMDSNVRKLNEIYNKFYVELGSEKLIHLAREHRYLSSGDSSIFHTSVLGLRSSGCINPGYKPSQVERAALIIVTMLKMKFSLEDNTLFPTLHTDQIHPQQERFNLYMLKYLTYPHAFRYAQFRQRYRMFFMTSNYMDMYSRCCVPVSNSNSSNKKIGDSIRNNFREYSALKQFSDSRHICVISKGIIYKFDIVGVEKESSYFSSSKEKVYSFNKIAKTLHFIKLDSENRSNNLLKFLGNLNNNPGQMEDDFNYHAIGIGALTALPREEWGRLRNHLQNLSISNQQNLHDIESALCVLCLDDINKLHERSISFLLDDSDVTHNTKYYLCENSVNRWFDKSTQIVVNSKSNAAVLNNLACCDAAPASRLISEVSLCEKFSPYIYESNHPIKVLDFNPLNWTTDNFTNTQIKQASTYSHFMGGSIIESHKQIRLPFFINYNMNYFLIRYLLVKILGYSMRKFKKPIRTGVGIYRFCKDGYFDVISLINKSIYNELTKHDGIYGSDTESYPLMNYLGQRIYESFSEPYHVSLFDALIYMAKLNNIEICHFDDPLFQNHIIHYELYVGSVMNRFVDFAAILPPTKDSVMFSFQADDPSRYMILSYNISAGKARANHLNHYDLIKFIETPFK